MLGPDAYLEDCLPKMMKMIREQRIHPNHFVLSTTVCWNYTPPENPFSECDDHICTDHPMAFVLDSSWEAAKELLEWGVSPQLFIGVYENFRPEIFQVALQFGTQPLQFSSLTRGSLLFADWLLRHRLSPRTILHDDSFWECVMYVTLDPLLLKNLCPRFVASEQEIIIPKRQTLNKLIMMTKVAQRFLNILQAFFPIELYSVLLDYAWHLQTNADFYSE